MRSRRGIAINNSLVHGICNYNCTLCSVNKSDWQGPRKLQSEAITRALIARILEAGRAGINIRYVANAGDGEPTLHPDFARRLQLFAEMVRGWPDDAAHDAPEVSVVTNGARLVAPRVLDALADAGMLTLIVSLPTVNAEDYGQVMMGRPELGKALLARALRGLAAAMRLRAEGKLRRLVIHVSPPERELIRRGFDDLVARLCAMASDAGLGEIELTLFPATANRAGLLEGGPKQLDMFTDLLRRYHGQRRDGVTLALHRVLERFFVGPGELLDLLKSSAFPCIWNASFFITPDGDSVCCNDQHADDVQGNIRQRSLAELLAFKEQMLPGPSCENCDQSPTALKGSFSASLYRTAAQARLAFARRSRR